jgi:hypothetical protein
MVTSSVVDPHHLDADPHHYDADPPIRIRLITPMQMQIRILIFLFHADPDPTFHPDADPDPDTDPSFKKSSNLEKCQNKLIFHTFWLDMRMRFRIQLINFDAHPDF